MKENEFNDLIYAMNVIGNMICREPDGWISEDGEVHKDIALLHTPEEIRMAVSIINNFSEKLL